MRVPCLSRPWHGRLGSASDLSSEAPSGVSPTPAVTVAGCHGACLSPLHVHLQEELVPPRRPHTHEGEISFFS